ncbi:hypothetical protein [Alteribacillus bidgolensis]|uniref:ABC-2 family transporter protein n=1 Tax=Alteribacillus bidgolensis TaxID=930129 RepID=A0A1G8E028_9BACI|nr:hypothetical protein [Alteribacillus bidgolensis]SDH63322.1 hypothetical protein SAMN05216352_10225 [Alteribacillus bidgolensis]
MMYLTENSAVRVTWQQYLFKMKAYISVFSSLVIIQLLGILLSFSGTASRGTSAYGMNVNITYYSADMVIVFTAIWGFICALLLTTTAYREDGFHFVANRISSNLSSVAFLFTASLAGGITAVFSGFLLKVLIYYILADEILGTGAAADPMTFAQGIAKAVLIIFFISSFGYLVGMMAQWYRWFAFFLPAALMGLLIVQGAGEGTILQVFYTFFFDEASTPLFFSKMIGAVCIIFAAAIFLSNQLEVKK